MDNDESWLLELDKLRRSSGISIDNRGHWWHLDQPFEHQRVIKILNQGLDWYSDIEETLPRTPMDLWKGEAIIKMGDQWCYVSCNLTPFLITKLQIGTQDKLIAKLNTGEEYELGPLALRDEIIYSRLRFNRLARFSVHAQLQVIDWLEEDQNSQMRLTYKDQSWPIILVNPS